MIDTPPGAAGAPQRVLDGEAPLDARAVADADVDDDFVARHLRDLDVHLVRFDLRAGDALKSSP